MTASLIAHALTDDYAGEVFKQHPVYSHLFVSDHGRVWSDKSSKFVGRLSGGGLGQSGRRRTPTLRYYRVCVGGKPQVNVNTSALVLETFVGPRPADHDADHINHDHLDDRLSNLRWRPVGENRADVIR